MESTTETTSSVPTANETNERRARLVKTFAYYSVFVVLGLAASVTGPTLDGLSKHTHSPVNQISYLFVLRSLGYLTGALLAGRLYDRVKGHPLMVGAVVVMAVSMFLVPIVPFLWLLALVAMILGTAEGLADVGGNTLLIWTHRDDMKMYMNGLHFFFGFGALLSPIVVGLVLARTSDINWAYWLLAALMVPSAIWLSRLPSPRPAHAEESAAPKRPAIPVLIGLLLAFMFLYVGAEVSYGGYISKYAIDSKLAPPDVAAYLASGFWGALTAGRLLAIPLSRRVSSRVTLLVDLLVMVIGLGIVIALPASFTALWIGTVIVGVGMASVFPTILILAEENMTITGFISSWFFVGSSLGTMSISWLVGQLFVGPMGARSAPLVIAAPVVVDLILLGVIVLYIRGRKQAAGGGPPGGGALRAGR